MFLGGDQQADGGVGSEGGLVCLPSAPLSLWLPCAPHLEVKLPHTPRQWKGAAWPQSGDYPSVGLGSTAAGGRVFGHEALCAKLWAMFSGVSDCLPAKRYLCRTFKGSRDVCGLGRRWAKMCGGLAKGPAEVWSFALEGLGCH